MLFALFVILKIPRTKYKNYSVIVISVQRYNIGFSGVFWRILEGFRSKIFLRNIFLLLIYFYPLKRKGYKYEIDEIGC